MKKRDLTLILKSEKGKSKSTEKKKLEKKN